MSQFKVGDKVSEEKPKYREFWLFKFDDGDSYHTREVTRPQPNDIHVIEYAAYENAVTEFSKLLKAKIEEHAEAYSTDIFPEDSTSSDAHAAKMGRHMCKVFLEYIEECK